MVSILLERQLTYWLTYVYKMSSNKILHLKNISDEQKMVRLKLDLLIIFEKISFKKYRNFTRINPNKRNK